MNVKCLNTKLPEDILKLEAFGDFRGALRVIDMRLEGNIPGILKERLEFEKVRIERLKGEYIYTIEEAVSLACGKIKDFSRDKLLRMKDEGYADWAYVDGVCKFHHRFLDNIIKTYPDVKGSLIGDEDSGEKQNRLLDDTIGEIIKDGSKRYYIRIKAGVKLNKEASFIGDTVRVYVPIPASCAQIRNIRILGCSPEASFISPEDYPQRTVYFEKKATGEDEFTVEYSYENYVEYKKLDISKVSKSQPSFDTEEIPPHIMFTPYLKGLAGEIAGEEKNKLCIARKFYDFITTRVKYSFVREYCTIGNIPEYAALNLKGDCGVQALLFITLCRIAGIPARWQSGLYVNPYTIGCHDWAQFYIEPYGWLFADPSFGRSAYRNGNTKRWNYYFGSIDPFRMAANSKFQYCLLPEKKYLRADPYDNQRGEVEYNDRGIYFDGFESIMNVIDVHAI